MESVLSKKLILSRLIIMVAIAINRAEVFSLGWLFNLTLRRSHYEVLKLLGWPV